MEVCNAPRTRFAAIIDRNSTEKSKERAFGEAICSDEISRDRVMSLARTDVSITAIDEALVALQGSDQREIIESNIEMLAGPGCAWRKYKAVDVTVYNFGIVIIDWADWLLAIYRAFAYGVHRPKDVRMVAFYGIGIPSREIDMAFSLMEQFHIVPLCCPRNTVIHRIELPTLTTRPYELIIPPPIDVQYYSPQDFFSERLIRDSNSCVSEVDAYQRYVIAAKLNGDSKPVSSAIFSRALMDMGVSYLQVCNIAVFTGLRFRALDDPDPEGE
jgi:hypothetical protein